MIFGFVVGIVLAALFFAVRVWRAMPLGYIHPVDTLGVMLAIIAIATAFGGIFHGLL